MKIHAYSLAFAIPILPVSLATAATESTETVVVTGQTLQNGLHLQEPSRAGSHVGLSPMNTPASVEIISEQDLKIKADYNAINAVTRATGFSTNATPGNGGTSMSVRGFSGHSSIVQTFDGIQMLVGAGTRTFPADTWTLEKIEVLRGPGSVINGVGAIGATVNYVPKTAKFGEVKNEVDVNVGSFNLRRVAFGSGGTATDTLAYRFDIVNHESDGYFDNGEESKQAVAGSILFQPTDDLGIKLSIDYSDVEPAKYWGTPLVNEKIDSATRENNYNIRNGEIEYEDWWPRLGIHWRLNDNITLRSDTYYLEANRHWRNVETYENTQGTEDVVRSFYLEILHELEQVGNRTDLLMDFDMGGVNHTISVGAEVNQIDFTHYNNRPYAGDTEVALYSPIHGTWEEGVESQTSRDFSSDTTQYAVFVEDNITFNDQWSLVAGLRHDKYDYKRHDFERPNGEDDQTITDKFSGTSWRIGTVFKPFSNTSLYGQYSEALDPIGSVLTSTNPDLKLAEGKQVEIGIKQSTWEERLQYTLAIYDIVKKNIESSDPGGITRQIGQQSSQGIELDIFAKPIDSLTIDFNVAYVDAQYDEFEDNSGNYKGNSPRNIPDTTANLWVNWHVLHNWSIGGGSRYVAERYADHANSEGKKLPSYLVFDASLSWMPDPSLIVSLRGKNLTDEEDYVLASYGSTQWVLAEGRSVELGLNYQF